MTRIRAHGMVRTYEDAAIEFAIILEVEDPALVETLFELLFPRAIYHYSVQED